MSEGTTLFEFLLRDYKFMNAIDRLTLKVMQKEDNNNLDALNVPELVMLLMDLLTNNTKQADLNLTENLVLLNHIHNYIVGQLQCASFDEPAFTNMFHACTRLAYLKVDYYVEKKPKKSFFSCFHCFSLKR
jgi:hypothetical protein